MFQQQEIDKCKPDPSDTTPPVGWEQFKGDCAELLKRFNSVCDPDEDVPAYVLVGSPSRILISDVTHYVNSNAAKTRMVESIREDFRNNPHLTYFGFISPAWVKKMHPDEVRDPNKQAGDYPDRGEAIILMLQQRGEPVEQQVYMLTRSDNAPPELELEPKKPESISGRLSDFIPSEKE